MEQNRKSKNICIRIWFTEFSQRYKAIQLSKYNLFNKLFRTNWETICKIVDILHKNEIKMDFRSDQKTQKCNNN